MGSALWKDRKRIFGMPLSFTRYELDEERLTVKMGLINQVEEEIMLYRIVDMTLNMTLINRVFGVGNIKIYSSDASTPEFKILRIKEPKAVRDKLSELVHKQRRQIGIRMVNYES